ncbi:unnamed protein product [Phaedon cochleariae]|uniref:TNFR-Cys domain-containing protein n=1 Tax=Phaedon cochleariae TaxID=80249 RepID=A0A9N9X0U3_PHACE|nr:unnamed protein product [Phaedon cochleariae]
MADRGGQEILSFNPTSCDSIAIFVDLPYYKLYRVIQCDTNELPGIFSFLMTSFLHSGFSSMVSASFCPEKQFLNAKLQTCLNCTEYRNGMVVVVLALMTSLLHSWFSSLVSASFCPEKQFLNARLQTCLNCTECRNGMVVLRPCEFHRDTLCATIEELLETTDTGNPHRHKHNQHHHHQHKAPPPLPKSDDSIVWRFGDDVSKEHVSTDSPPSGTVPLGTTAPEAAYAGPEEAFSSAETLVWDWQAARQWRRLKENFDAGLRDSREENRKSSTDAQDKLGDSRFMKRTQLHATKYSSNDGRISRSHYRVCNLGVIIQSRDSGIKLIRIRDPGISNYPPREPSEAADAGLADDFCLTTLMGVMRELTPRSKPSIQLMSVSCLGQKVLTEVLTEPGAYKNPLVKALSSSKINSKLVWSCIESLESLGANNRVTLLWVPGHQGVEGNEKSDILAKQGTESVFIGPEPYFGVTASAAKTTISGWAEGKTLTYWSELPGLTHSKAFLPKPWEKITRQILEWSRGNLRILTGLLTGHCRLRYHLGRMGLNQQTDCRFCCVEDETAEHILCSCSSLERLRFDTFGFTNLEPIDFRQISPNSTMNFVKRCGLYGEL